MAEGGHISCSSGSEFIYDFYCELCVEDGKQLEAHGYCSNCKEYLCEECYHGHKKTRSSRHHVLVDKSNMPKDTPLPSNRVSKMISTMCESHTEEVVKFYCKSHNVFGCSTCFITEHRSCPDVENILEKSENILESQEYKRFMQKLKSMMKKSEDMLKLSRDNKTLIRTRCSDAVCAVRKVKEDAFLILEKIESNCVKIAENLCSEGEEQMDNIAKEFSTLSERIESVNSEVEGLFSSKRACQLYITMKKTEQDIISLQERLSNAERKNAVKSFTFEPNSELKSYLKSIDILGEIIYQDEGARQISPRSSNEPNKMRAKKIVETNVGTQAINPLTSQPIYPAPQCWGDNYNQQFPGQGQKPGAPGGGDPSKGQDPTAAVWAHFAAINPQTGQPDYSQAWAEYYRAKGMHYQANAIPAQQAQQQQGAGGQPSQPGGPGAQYMNPWLLPR